VREERGRTQQTRDNRETRADKTAEKGQNLRIFFITITLFFEKDCAIINRRES
jgi:hypothetical protein